MQVIRHRWRIVAFLAVIGALIGLGLSASAGDSYSSTGKVYVSFAAQTDFDVQNATMTSFVELASDGHVIENALEVAGVHSLVGDVRDHLDVYRPSGSTLVELSFRDANRDVARELTRALSSTLASTINDLQARRGQANAAEAFVLEESPTPVAPATTPLPVYIGAGLGAGFALGIISALLLRLFAPRVWGLAEIAESLYITPLGAVALPRLPVAPPNGPTNSTHGDLVTALTDGPSTDDFRMLRTQLTSQIRRHSPHLPGILLTSVLEGEGRTTTAAGLAVSFALSDTSVVLVNAHLRAPKRHHTLDPGHGPGLNEVLRGHSSLHKALRNEGLVSILGSGSSTLDSTELLATESMSEILRDLDRLYDVVIIDAPPLSGYADTAVLSSHVGGIVLVVQAGRARWSQLETAIAPLRVIDPHFYGAVLTKSRAAMWPLASFKLRA